MHFLKLRSFFKRIAARIHRKSKVRIQFIALYQKPFDKLPLNCAIDDIFHSVMLEEAPVFELDEFFQWANVEMLFLDQFFRSAEFPQAIEYHLDQFFRMAELPKVIDYQFDEFFLMPDAIDYQLDQFFRLAEYPQVKEYLLDEFFDQFESTQIMQDEDDPLALVDSMKKDLVVKARSMSCSFETVAKPCISGTLGLKRCLSQGHL